MKGQIWLILAVAILCLVAIAIPQANIRYRLNHAFDWIPVGSRSMATAPMNSCINNLRLIDGAKQQWALDHKVSYDSIPTKLDLWPYLSRGTPPGLAFCPSGGKYSYNCVTNAPTCTITNHILP